MHKAMLDDRERSYHWLMKDLFTKEAIHNAREKIAPRYLEEGRKGGFTRVIPVGRRWPDSAEMAVIELVNNPMERWEKEQAKKDKAELGKPSYWEWELKILRQEQVYFKQQLDSLQT